MKAYGVLIDPNGLGPWGLEEKNRHLLLVLYGVQLVDSWEVVEVFFVSGNAFIQVHVSGSSPVAACGLPLVCVAQVGVWSLQGCEPPPWRIPRSRRSLIAMASFIFLLIENISPIISQNANTSNHHPETYQPSSNVDSSDMQVATKLSQYYFCTL